jgi:DNA uptake protein ComE-like DNA-binding protein
MRRNRTVMNQRVMNRPATKRRAGREQLARKSAASRRRGMLLLVVLVVIVILTLGAYTFCELMISQKETAIFSGRRLQCQAAVDSGVEHVRRLLYDAETARTDSGGLFDNMTSLRGINVVGAPDAVRRVNFTVVSPRVDQEGYLGGIRFGLEDESSRLNLNALMVVDKTGEGAARDMLMTLPGMTESIADAILDWIDADDEPREYGVERDYYASQSPPYAPKNGPFETVEELLRVKDVTPQMLFGIDTNRNGQIDASEQSESTTAMLQSGTNGSMDRGWQAYITLYAMEKNVRADGAPRIFLNSDDLETLHSDLQSALTDPKAADFVILYRQFGASNSAGTNAGLAGGAATSTKYVIDFETAATKQITSVADLIGASVNAQVPKSDGTTETVVVPSPFEDNPIAMSVYLPDLMDAVTTVEQPTIPCRININQAPRSLLDGIPNITPEIVDAIIEERGTEIDPEDKLMQTEAWILGRGVVTLAQYKQLSAFICAGGDVYRAQVIGYYESGGSSARSEVIFDATGDLPRVLFWRDISHLGRGYPIETLGITGVSAAPTSGS